MQFTIFISVGALQFYDRFDANISGGDTPDPNFGPFAPLWKSRLCCTGGSRDGRFGRLPPPWIINRGGGAGYFWFMDHKMKQ